ncbi:MAG: MlaE family lipid ABC transporter permease subunit [Desulfotignum sp.]|jgi:phospholipid/cholesterol/gamma-HCH transport system permease protein|nr:MlaE family lipid ABC transporter permease subunit [Desulfotignum sp.]
MKQHAALTIDQTDKTLVFSFSGNLDAKGIAGVWKTACTRMRKASGPALAIDLSGISYFDTAGAAFIAHLEQMARDRKWEKTDITGLDPAAFALVERIRQTESETSGEAAAPAGALRTFVENKGRSLNDFLNDAHTFIAFAGEIFWAFLSSLVHPGRVRWAETLRVAERAGADALPIVALISFIVGLVMAFQSAIPMKMFGAEIYVANLIGMAMVRELGPLMTAIVLAGRSASAFAAEIGTMKINEEIDALTVMGLDPVRFLILPRVMASTLMTPLLTVFAILVGILGGAIVLLSLGHPFAAYYNQVAGFVSWGDFVGGIIKCFVFGVLIAATGCIRGYQTSQGPSAVGEAATRAVVSSIVLIAVFDGIFSILYYALDV